MNDPRRVGLQSRNERNKTYVVHNMHIEQYAARKSFGIIQEHSSLGRAHFSRCICQVSKRLEYRLSE